MIPHHHHDSASNSIPKFQAQVNTHISHDEYIHNNNEHHRHHDKKESGEANSHSFPPHSHTLASEDYSFPKLTVDSGTNISVTSFVVLSKNTGKTLNKLLLNNNERQYLGKPFLISSLFQPEANGLRGPPYMV